MNPSCSPIPKYRSMIYYNPISLFFFCQSYETIWANVSYCSWSPWFCADDDYVNDWAPRARPTIPKHSSAAPGPRGFSMDDTAHASDARVLSVRAALRHHQTVTLKVAHPAQRAAHSRAKPPRREPYMLKSPVYPYCPYMLIPQWAEPGGGEPMCCCFCIPCKRIMTRYHTHP